MKYNKCVVPDCEGNFIPGRYSDIKIMLCMRHYEMMKFFVWMLENMKVVNKKSEIEQKAEDMGIVLPK